MPFPPSLPTLDPTPLQPTAGTQATFPVAATHSFILIHSHQTRECLIWKQMYTLKPQVTRPIDKDSKEVIAVKSLVYGPGCTLIARGSKNM